MDANEQAWQSDILDALRVCGNRTDAIKRIYEKNRRTFSGESEINRQIRKQIIERFDAFTMGAAKAHWHA